MQAYQRTPLQNKDAGVIYIEVNKAMKDPGLTPEQKLKLIGIRDIIKSKL